MNDMDFKGDIYKDTPLRYLGYANEVGESFRAIIGRKWVNFSYGIATLYVFADTFDKTWEAYKICREDTKLTKSFQKVAYKGADTLLWQMLASVAIPGYTINRICAFTTFLLKKNGNIPQKLQRILVPGVALASIPLIIKPIDHGTDYLLDNSFRKIGM